MPVPLQGVTLCGERNAGIPAANGSLLSVIGQNGKFLVGCDLVCCQHSPSTAEFTSVRMPTRNHIIWCESEVRSRSCLRIAFRTSSSDGRSECSTCLSGIGISSIRYAVARR